MFSDYCFYSNITKSWEDFPKAPSRLKIDDSLLFDKFNIRKKDLHFLKTIGAVPDLNSPSGWCKLSQDVDEHKDGFGKTLLFCDSGASTFHYYNGVEFFHIALTKGSYLVFDDYNDHSLTVHTRTTNLLVCGVKGFLKKQDNCFFKGNFK